LKSNKKEIFEKTTFFTVIPENYSEFSNVTCIKDYQKTYIEVYPEGLRQAFNSVYAKDFVDVSKKNRGIDFGNLCVNYNDVIWSHYLHLFGDSRQYDDIDTLLIDILSKIEVGVEPVTCIAVLKRDEFGFDHIVVRTTTKSLQLVNESTLCKFRSTYVVVTPKQGSNGSRYIKLDAFRDEGDSLTDAVAQNVYMPYMENYFDSSGNVK
jgi:hypothetical protein